MKKPLVSIVTPCYNGERFIGRFLDSVLKQSYPNLELVLVNDGSKDGTAEVVESYREKLQKRGIRLVYEYQENAGQAAALNRGLKLFSGDYLLWMDSDDAISEDFIEVRVDYLEKNPNVAYCYGKAAFYNEGEYEKPISVVGKREKTGRYDFFVDVLYFRDVFFPGYLCRTGALERVIPDREIYAGRGGQNAQLLLPLAWHYGEPGFVEKSTYYYYIRRDSHSHSQNTSEKMIAQLEKYEKIVTATIERIDDTAVQDYIPKMRREYARLRFGNAVDTRKGELIQNYYRELRSLGIVNWHDTLMLVKYSFPVFRSVFGAR